MTPAAAVEEINKFRDHHKLIVQKNGNGGDCAHKSGIFYFLAKRQGLGLYVDFMRDCLKLEVKLGVFIRHPDRAPDWNEPGVRDFARWNDPKVFSRDQTLMMVLAFGLYLDDIFFRGVLSRFFKAHLKRFMFCQNGDLHGPQHLAVWIRAFGNKWFYPFLYFSDLFLLGGSIIDWLKARRDPEDTSDAITGTMMHLQAQHSMPTFISRWSCRILKSRGNGLQDAWNKYFDPSTHAPPFHVLAEPVINGMCNGR